MERDTTTNRPGELTAAEKIRNAEIMFGTGSPQHLAAIKRFGK